MSKHYYTFLALGDSYTIGESLPLHESFPYQAIQLLRNNGQFFQAPEILAKTGWTSAELADHILHTKLNESYDFVSLLIGVNNQYRGLPVAEFISDFGFLLRKAIHLSGNKPSHVMVLSIPDWGHTPFATKRDTAKISSEINTLNEICEAAAKKAQTHFIPITEDTRKVKNNPELLAQDQLHYAAPMHHIWAEKINTVILSEIQKNAIKK